MPLIETRGAGSAQGFGEFAQSAAPVYIEDVFSTYLYTGTGSSQTITNGIDLSGKGGLVWTKPRNTSSTSNSHILTDTARGAYYQLFTNTSGAQYYPGGAYGISFASSGFSLVSSDVGSNSSSDTYASWTFRKQKKFFDVVTYTGNGTSSQTLSHNLGSVPGCVIFKKLNNNEDWTVWHRSLSTNQYLILNSTSSVQTLSGLGPASGALTSTTITVPTFLNTASDPFVAYIFAHDAGGFGLTGSDNVISCGSFTGAAGSGDATINLGYEPQWILWKRTDSSTDGWWAIQDTFRGWTMSSGAPLFPNTSAAESSSPASGYFWIGPTSSTTLNFSSGSGAATYIYIAIRRGPMKVPTSGTSVFSPVARTGTGATAQITGIGFPPDLAIGKPRTGYGVGTAQFDRLRGTSVYLAPSWTDAEISDTTMVTSFNMDGISLGADTTQRYFNGSSGTYANWLFRRAPGFFDVVCYTGTGANQTLNHNLGVAPELIIIKSRNGAIGWDVNTSFTSSGYSRGALNSSTQFYPQTYPDTITAQPTATQFSVSSNIYVGANFYTYVAYLFASCPGVSKVGSYTGTGTTLQIDCGFTGGARFILIKRTDSTGDWYVWDTARGIVASTDPYLVLNSTAAEVTTTDWVDTYSAGFELSSAAGNNVNINAASYIFLSIS